MKMKLISRRVRSKEELAEMEDSASAVCGPSPTAFAARHGLKLSKSYLAFMRSQKANGTRARKATHPRRNHMGNPKFEGRKPKEIRSPNDEKDGC